MGLQSIVEIVAKYDHLVMLLLLLIVYNRLTPNPIRVEVASHVFVGFGYLWIPNLR